MITRPIPGIIKKLMTKTIIFQTSATGPEDFACTFVMAPYHLNDHDPLTMRQHLDIMRKGKQSTFYCTTVAKITAGMDLSANQDGVTNYVNALALTRQAVFGAMDRQIQLMTRRIGRMAEDMLTLRLSDIFIPNPAEAPMFQAFDYDLDFAAILNSQAAKDVKKEREIVEATFTKKEEDSESSDPEFYTQ